MPVDEPSADAVTSKLVDALARSRLRGTTVARPEFPFSLHEAYTIQERVADRLESPPVGWKVGSTSREAQERLGTDEPGSGRLFERFAYPDGAEIPVATAHDVHVEVEFAFEMGGRLAPRDTAYSTRELRGAVTAFIPAIEIVGSRFSTGLGGSGRNLVTADGGANIAFIGGRPYPLPDGLVVGLDLSNHPCDLRVNGDVVARGSGGRALGDPLQVLVWITNHLSQRGLGLDAGAIVTTGTCTGLLPVGPGDQLRGDFGELGSVEATLLDHHATD